MSISNAFLYIPAKREKYTFSINFPMSVNKINSTKLLISMGVGDFYTYVFEKSAEEIKKLCIHDTEKFDAQKFEYIIEEC